MQSHSIPPRHSYARNWRDLRTFVLEALGDAMHHSATLASGRPPALTLVLSPRLLPLNLHQPPPQLATLSAELRQWGVVPHTIHVALAGEPNSQAHCLQIYFPRNALR